MPMKVWREAVRIQRNFLWGGLSRKRRISWVKWEDLCKPKEEGGLGIRNLRVVNLSLLAKWRWRLLSEEDEVWKKVIFARYGEGALGNANLDFMVHGNSSSTWWGDLCKLDKEVGWFNQVVSKKVGMGNSVKFWKDVWVGNQSLEHRFPRLFGISVQQNEMVQNMGVWMNGEWRWELLWRRQFFVWENELVRELGEVINTPLLSEEVDRWVWKPNEEQGFSVKSLYLWLDPLLGPRAITTPLEKFSFTFIWKCAAPSKVSALAWQLFLDRIPTKDNLCHRRIIRIEEASCAMCGGVVETSRHLFMHCDFVAQIWYAICRWLGVVVVLPPEVMILYGTLVCSGRNKRLRKGFSLVWLAFMWVIWRSRNEKIFNNVVGVVEDAVDLIQRLSWQWYLSKNAKVPCLLYEWVWNPGDCMLR
ncbi:ribonuclease H protein [Trifolium medium]|uniref:Ribonuclease H protein n=1 Tax=Trifolium medium TaxID=97028 RepID=A0A392LZ87_9FABA|nr:ribonuclease H protein [Trifolium medium]